MRRWQLLLRLPWQLSKHLLKVGVICSDGPMGDPRPSHLTPAGEVYPFLRDKDRAGRRIGLLGWGLIHGPGALWQIVLGQIVQGRIALGRIAIGRIATD